MFLSSFFDIKNKEKNFIMNKNNASKNYIAPTYIDNRNHKYLEIDNKYFSGLIIINYARIQEKLILEEFLMSKINMNISIFFEKQDSYKKIRELTYHIANLGAEVKTTDGKNQDIDIAISTIEDAKYIRNQMQINKEEMYYIFFYICVWADNKEELEFNLRRMEVIALSLGLQIRRASFRQEQCFNSCTPLMQNSKDVKIIAKRNILTDGLVSMYPFISSEICEEDGILLGLNSNNNSLVMVNKFNNIKYKNANIFILGTSGSGKSYFTKLMILRNRYLGINQYIIDPDREYINLCKALSGTAIKLGHKYSTYINIMEIRKESIEEENVGGYLSNKINKLHGFFNIVFGEMTLEERAILEEKIIICYEEKEITFDDKSLLKNNSRRINIKPIFKEPKDMPILEDLYNILLKDKNTKKFASKLKPLIYGSLKFLNNHTNIDVNNKLIVADIYDLGEENLKIGMYLITEMFWDKIKKDREIKKIIYLDEVWRLIGAGSNKQTAEFVQKIFKSIRKYGGSVVAITQDVLDLCSLEDGIYGKSIINNSSIKAIFKIEEDNINMLEKYINLSVKEKVDIKGLEKGRCLLYTESENLILKVEASESEHTILKI